MAFIDRPTKYKLPIKSANERSNKEMTSQEISTLLFPFGKLNYELNGISEASMQIES